MKKLIFVWTKDTPLEQVQSCRCCPVLEFSVEILFYKNYKNNNFCSAKNTTFKIINGNLNRIGSKVRAEQQQKISKFDNDTWT